MKTKTLQTGFTLIELLVVISVIGLLASIILVPLNNSRSKARDTKRATDARQMITALQYHLNDTGAFPSNSGCQNGWCCLGHGDTGTCWTVASGYKGKTALDNSLSPKYIAQIPDDPLNNTARYGDAYMYRLDTDAAGIYGTLHWGVEKSNPSAQDCAGGFSGYWGAGLGIGDDWWCMVAFR